MMNDTPTTTFWKRLEQWKCSEILMAVAHQELAAPDGEADGAGDATSSPDVRLFLGSSNFSVFEWAWSADEPRRLEFTGDRHTSYVTGMARCGDQLVSGSYDGRLIWWDMETRTGVRSLTAHDRWIRRVIATPDGREVISVADDMQCKVWDAATGALRLTLSDHAALTPHHYPSMLYAVAVSEDGQWLATADKVGHVAIWDLAEGTRVAALDAPQFYTWDPKQRIHSIGGIRSLAFSPDGQQLALGGIGQIGNIDHLGGPSRIELYRWESGEHLRTMEDDKRKGLVEQMAWHPSSPWLLAAGGDHSGFLTLWNLESGEMVAQEGTDGHVHGFALRSDWRELFVASHQRIERWEVPRAAGDEPEPDPT
jgi:WD40 repeat protein